MELLERLGLYARAPDSRPMAEIHAEIDEELEFHVAESARALAASGLDEAAAQAEARRRFGDEARIRRECARTQMGERIMLQRIQLALTSILIVAVGVSLWSNHSARAAFQAERETTAVLAAEFARLGQQLEARLAPKEGNAQADAIALAEARARELETRESEPRGDEPGEYPAADGRSLNFTGACSSWRARFAEQPTSWRDGRSVAEQLAALPGAHGAEILAGIWSGIRPEQHEQVLKVFMREGGHPHALEVLTLAWNRGGPIATRVLEHLPAYAWGHVDPHEWLAQHGDRPVQEVLTDSIASWANALTLAYVEREQSRRWEHNCVNLMEHLPRFRLDIAEAAGIDLSAILQRAGVCAIDAASFAEFRESNRRNLEMVLSWCKL